MGNSLILLASDGDYVTYGKRLELLANVRECRSALMFVMCKLRQGCGVFVVDGYDALEAFKFKEENIPRNVSEEWLEYEKEENL